MTLEFQSQINIQPTEEGGGGGGGTPSGGLSMTYIHENYKKILAIYIGAYRAPSQNATITDIVWANGNVAPATQTTLLGDISTVDIATTAYADMPVYFSESQVKMTNEYTLPLIGNLRFSANMTTKQISGNTVTHSCTITNNNSGAITIRKALVYRSDSDKTNIANYPNKYFLLYAIDLDEPVTIASGASSTVTFSIDTSNI